MTAIFGATYPGGLVMGADSFRVNQRLVQPKQEIHDAQKILNLPNMLVGSAGYTVLQNNTFGELLSISKVIASAIVTQEIKRKFNPFEIEKCLLECARLFSLFHDAVGIEVLVGVNGSRPRFFALSTDGKSSEHTFQAERCAIGEAKAYLWHYECPQLLPASYAERVKNIGVPPNKEKCSSKAEAEDWVNEVLEWTCKLVPESCGGEIRLSSLHNEAPSPSA